jgi:uncharacterized protein (DUF362 family)
MSTKNIKYSRRDFIKTGISAGIATSVLPVSFCSTDSQSVKRKYIVSIVKIGDNGISYAVEKAIDLLGGINSLTQGKEKILLKPNLVFEDPACTTKPDVIEAIAVLMKNAGKDVRIGEGSAAGGGFNTNTDGEVFRTRKQEILDGMQEYVFNQLGYDELAKKLRVPLINLHSGELSDVPVKDGYLFDKITLHKSIAESDLVCSVPMMKTHVLATVTLSMKNLIGVYPGTVYYSVRSWLHDHAAANGSKGISYEIVDMQKAVNTGFVVIDASTAMEGDGPSGGPIVDMGLIIAGTNPLAADMIASKLMGFTPEEIPSISLASKAGLGPGSLDEIEVRGEKTQKVTRIFKKPNIYPWPSISPVWGNKEI